MLCQFLIGLNEHRLIFVALLPVRRRRGVVGHEDRRNTAEELIHMDMCFDPGTFLLIDECFDEGILAVGHNADKDPGICDLAGIKISDLSRIARPVNLDLFAGLPGKVHCGIPLLLILLDVIAELGIHERVITGGPAVLKVFRPQ